MELVTPTAGRWWPRLRPSRLLGDARHQATGPQVGTGGRWPPGRRILGLGLVVVVLGGLWGIAAGVLVQAATDTAHPADALVVFAGGRGERLPKALVLLHQQVAPVLVISNGRDGRWQARTSCVHPASGSRWCARSQLQTRPEERPAWSATWQRDEAGVRSSW